MQKTRHEVPESKAASVILLELLHRPQPDKFPIHGRKTMKEAKDINGVPLHIGDEILCVDARGDIYHELDVATKYEIVYIVDSMSVYAEDVASTNFVALKNTDGFAYRFLLKSPMLIVRNARNEPGLWLCHPNRFAKPK